MTIFRRPTLRKYQAPDYAGMANVVFHSRAEGLVSNTTNSYGVVNASNHVTKWISVVTTTHEFDTNGTASSITLVGSGINKEIAFGGAARLRHNGASSVFNTFHYRAVQADLKWQIHGVIKFGATANPNATLGLYGNNGSSSASKGVHSLYGDATTNNNVISIGITHGSSNSFITIAGNNNVIPPNQFVDFFIKVDKSLVEDHCKLWINGRQYTIFSRVDAIGSVTTPTYAMEIGGCGNATLPFVGSIKEMTFQDGLNTDNFIRKFIRARMTKYRIAPIPYSVDSIIQNSKIKKQNTLDETRYYLNTFWMQKPSNPNIIVNIFTDTVDHVYNIDRKVSRRISTDRGKTISSKIDAYNPGGAGRPIDAGAGYGDDSRLHILADTQDGTGPGLTHQLVYLYSDDDGATWSSPVNIASSLPADGLATWRVYCRIIENGGRLMTVIYKFTEEGDLTNSARYLFYSDNNGTSWSTFTIQSVAGAGNFRNESAIIALSSTVLLVVSRDEGTGEWYQSMSTNNGATWTNQGALTLGESLGRAGPVRLKKFPIAGTDVVACYYPDRDQNTLKAVYGTAANLIASGLTGWNLSTKYTFFQGWLGQHLHYGDVCHYNNDFHANAIYPLDEFPSSGAGTENELSQYELGTIHYADVKTLLGL